MKQQESCSWPPLAIATVPMQEWNQTYRPEVAFKNGTIFPELHKPYMGASNRRDHKGGGCRWAKDSNC